MMTLELKIDALRKVYWSHPSEVRIVNKKIPRSLRRYERLKRKLVESKIVKRKINYQFPPELTASRKQSTL